MNQTITKTVVHLDSDPSEMQLSCWGENVDRGEQITSEIKQLTDFRSRVDVEIGRRLIEAKTLILKASPIGSAMDNYANWALAEFGLAASEAARLEMIAGCWGGDDEDLIDRMTIGALHEVARVAVKCPAVKEMALEHARSGESVNRNNVLEFRNRAEPAQGEIVASPPKGKEASGIDIMSIRLGWAKARVEWMTDLLLDIFKQGKVTQDHLDVAAANSLWGDEEEELTDHALSA
jgi:hypothetical protein